MKYAFFLLVAALLLPPPVSAQKAQDAFGMMLDELGLDESNLGFQPKGYWTRYPDPRDIPFKALAFDDLFAEPQRIHDFVRVMALAVEDYLHPDYLAGSDRGNSKGLLKVVYYCGVRNATAQLRDYSASLWAELDEEKPLLAAIRSIYERTGRVYRYNALGQASDFPLIERDLQEAIAPLHPDIRRALARTVVHLTDAWMWRQTGMRNVDMKKALDCWRIRHLGETQFDALEYFPQLEDCARTIDMNSIYYAGYKLLETSEMLADTLQKLKSRKDIAWKSQNLNVETPIGRIVISGTADDEHDYSDLLLLVDLGGDDVYRGAVGSTPSLDIPISLAVDLEGNDEYVNDDEFLPSQGAAIFGAGVLLDVEGDDVYRSKRLSQGAALLGIGVLADLDGDDEYHLWTSGQGGAYFGVGVAIDNRGDDEYTLWGDGQGYGGVGGVGTLVNRSGNDHYWCEPSSAEVFRPDYHSKEGKLNYSYAQGCGVGRRGDITDGHSWAGGMGTLIDLTGNDLYESANWSLGCGYWYGMGFVWDGSGDDRYHSANWTQASGAHFCIGALFDEGGDDEHIVSGYQSAGLGFGHDFTIAMLANRGGNDFYSIVNDGLGYAINMSQVFFFDTEGDDRYQTGGGRNFGRNNFRQYNPPIIGAFQVLFADQISIFADLQGNDTYLAVDRASGVSSVHPEMQDGVEFFFPTAAERDSLSNRRYYGLGKDFSGYSGAQIEAFRDKMRRRFEEYKD